MDMIESQSANLPDREKNLERFGLCVVRTLESIASDIAGKPLKFTDEEIDLRLKQMLDTEKLIKKRFVIPEFVGSDLQPFFEENEMIRLAPRLSPRVVRLDKMNISHLISQIKEGSTEISSVFKKADLKFVGGDLSAAKNYLHEGWRVGIITAGHIGGLSAIEQVHVFHLGLNQSGLFIDKSDTGSTQKIIEEGLLTGQVARMAPKLQKLTGGWNLLLVRGSLPA